LARAGIVSVAIEHKWSGVAALYVSLHRAHNDMSLFGSLFGNKEAAPNPIRETLFGDMPIDQWPWDGVSSESFPWSAFASARSHLAAGRQNDAVAGWRQILHHPELESRQYLQAWHFLRQNGEQPSPDISKQILGVVVEVALPKGLDLLACYSDHSARYFNYSGAGVVWEHQDTSLDEPIQQLITAASQVVANIGPWEQSRPGPPPRGHARMSFLTPSGLHFGQGPMDTLSRDPLGGRVIQLARVLMKVMVGKTNAANKDAR
jgi:hypothetical protein